MAPKDTTTATLLIYFVDAMPLAEDKLTWIHTVIKKIRTSCIEGLFLFLLYYCQVHQKQVRHIQTFYYQ